VPAPVANQLPAAVVVKAGYLKKRGQRSKRWQTRWFVLRSSGQLMYYETDAVRLRAAAAPAASDARLPPQQEYEVLHSTKLHECIEIGRVEHSKKPFAFQVIHPKVRGTRTRARSSRHGDLTSPPPRSARSRCGRATRTS
jgi:hypothetical protein